MKKLMIVFILMLAPALAFGQFYDHDGILKVTWSAPSEGNPLDHYIWSYNINGVVDSITGSAAIADTINEEVTLANYGDWAIFNVQAVSIFDDVSAPAVSDTAFYKSEEGISPPRFVNWIQGD